MNKLTDFRFSAWVDGNRKMCCIEANVPNSKLGYISFYMTMEEFYNFTKNYFCSFNDLGHNLRTAGDFCTFYDLDFPSSDNGVMQVPYVNVNIPMFARKVLMKWAQKQWNSLETHMERPQLNIDQKRLERWTRLHGRGTGSVVVEMYNDTTETFFKEKVEEPGSNLKDMVERLQTIARNSTRAFYQTAKVRLSKDWDGFYFVVPGMNGGIVNHAREDSKADWSIHT